MVHSVREQRSRAEDTHRSSAIGQRSYAQPPIPTASAPRAPVSGLPLHSGSKVNPGFPLGQPWVPVALCVLHTASSFPPLASCQQLSDSRCSAARRGSTASGLHGHQMMPRRKTCRTRVFCSISRSSELITGMPPKVSSFGWKFKKIVSVSKFLAGRMQWGRAAVGMEAVGPPSDSKCDSVKG